MRTSGTGQETATSWPNLSEQRWSLFGERYRNQSQPSAESFYENDVPSTNIAFRMVTQRIVQGESFRNLPPIDTHNIERIYPGGDREMYALTRPDGNGNRALLALGGEVRSGGKPRDTADVQIVNLIGKHPVPGRQVVDVDPNSITIGADFIGGQLMNGTPWMRASINSTFSEEQQATYRQYQATVRGNADFGIEGYLMLQRHDGKRDGKGASMALGLEKKKNLP